MTLLLLQVGIPLLLAGLVALPARSRILKALQAFGAGAYLLAVHLAGVWLDVPWWTPWLLWGIFASAFVRGWTKSFRKGRATWLTWLTWLAIGAWALLAIGSAWLATTALLGRRPPPGPIIDLATPLPEGRYLVVNGGNAALINAHLETLEPKTPRQAAHRGQSHGLDIVALHPGGRAARGLQASDPASHRIFGVPVLAPCDGRVIATLDGRRDMPVPMIDLEVMGGNHVVLDCGGVEVALAHFKRGSVRVRAGQSVRAGTPLGLAGNSGNSDAPHLHIHAQRPGSKPGQFDADPLPLRIEGRYLVRGDRL